MSQMLALALATIVVAACGADPIPTQVEVPSNPWGPLAVTRDGNGQKARTEGVLQITETCVFLAHRNDRSLLIWPSAQTSWDQASQTIRFSDRDGQMHRLSNGQRVAFGGGGGSAVEDGPGQLNRVPWVVAPMPECVAPAYWFVGDLAT